VLSASLAPSWSYEVPGCYYNSIIEMSGFAHLMIEILELRFCLTFGLNSFEKIWDELVEFSERIEVSVSPA
jgi:hypothetical protein